MAEAVEVEVELAVDLTGKRAQVVSLLLQARL
jgi:hypothetical protein